MTQPQNPHDERAPNERPVDVVAPLSLVVATPAGSGTVPLFVTGAWPANAADAVGLKTPAPPASATNPAYDEARVRRAVILIHGRLRNADAYFDLAQEARALAGGNGRDTVLIVPQFLATADVAAHGLAPSTLHWDWTGWMGGGNAEGPAPISSFEVLDAILAVLADRERYPALTDIVIAGHSGGGQVVQRYAVVARGEAAVRSRGIALRYVIANPSSYVYFDETRPDATGGFVKFDAAACPRFNQWKYGLADLPGYVNAGREPQNAAELEAKLAADLEAAYVQRDVVILLGGDDCDPRHPALDRSCAARAQGEHRLGRGRAYARYMAARHPVGLRHRTLEVADVGHDAHGIFSSAQGLAAVFDVDGFLYAPTFNAPPV